MTDHATFASALDATIEAINALRPNRPHLADSYCRAILEICRKPLAEISGQDWFALGFMQAEALCSVEPA